MTGSECNWRVVDESVRLAHCSIREDDFLVYARTYTVRQGYHFSETNNLIYNLKIGVPVPPGRKRYKMAAIRQFATEAGQLLSELGRSGEAFVLIPMPPSKSRESPDYDDRLEQVARLIVQRTSNVTALELLRGTCSTEAMHLSGAPRSVEECLDSMEVDEPLLQKSQGAIHGKNVLVLDDILTSGAHFEAARQLLTQHLDGGPCGGIFWAKAVEFVSLQGNGSE